MADDYSTTPAVAPPADYVRDDGKDLSIDEKRSLRRLLERERRREEWCKNARWWLGTSAVGMTTLAGAHQIGLFDFIAGVIMRMKSP